MRSLEQFIQTVKGQNNFSKNAFLTCSWRFLRLDKLEQLKFKLKKIIGIEKHAGKVIKGAYIGIKKSFVKMVSTNYVFYSF